MTEETPEEKRARETFEQAQKNVASRRRAAAKDFTGDDKPVAYKQSRHKEINLQLAALEGLLIDIRERVSNLETEMDFATLIYRGVFQRAESYTRGDLVTADGGLWYCLRAVHGAEAKPGTDEGAPAWQLMTKSR